MAQHPGPLGFIEPKDRTQEQHDAHAAALTSRVRFTLPPVMLAKGDKVLLTDTWKHPLVVADCGMEFTGFHQLTGSCVGASAGNCVFTLGGVQRLLTSGATKAFIPFWPYFYGRTRFNEGDRGQGEGAVDSVMGQTLAKEGCFEITQAGLPTFSNSDGLTLTEKTELQYSDGAASVVTKWLDLGKQHPVKGIATLNDTAGIASAIVNGYPVLDGCSQYVGNGSIKGSGSDAYVAGHYDGSGGHSTCFLGVWEHPNDGRLFLYSNQWPASTYPKDPAGAGRCCVWMTEAEVSKLFSRYGGDNGETMALSHLDYFPSQPELLNWLI